MYYSCAVSNEAQPAKKDSKKKTDSNNIKKKKTRYSRLTRVNH